ncbi:hypothetical protein [Psychrobacillus sp.]|uniref:hypothetical protein n=1 Tax=Psychrobacillus sp. TaxID=1871623 RepID=UPI0028BE1378|nr:hypothetical protein [Psychrobacillus sp.]
MAKKGEQKLFEATTKEKYTFQHPGLRESVRMRDKSKNEHGVQQGEKLYEAMMEHVIFKEDGTKVSFEHFEEVGGFSEVMAAAVKFTFQEG